MKGAGEWAVITGAASGIGRAFAKNLAAKEGFKFLLIDCNEEGLAAVADAMTEEYGVVTKTCVVDLSKVWLFDMFFSWFYHPTG